MRPGAAAAADRAADRGGRAGGRQGALARTLGAAALVWAVRIGAIYVGSWLGAWLGGTPPEHRRKVWYGMVTQARDLPLRTTPLASLTPLLDVVQGSLHCTDSDISLCLKSVVYLYGEK